jgi:hypothetical protein
MEANKDTKTERKAKTAREITREMIAKAAAKNGGKLVRKGQGSVDARRFSRL